MDIKLKSKLSRLILLVVSLYMIATSLICFKDINSNNTYFSKKKYYESDIFKNNMAEYINYVLELNTSYKGYSLKSDYEKVSQEDINRQKEFYDQQLKISMENSMQTDGVVTNPTTGEIVKNPNATDIENQKKQLIEEAKKQWLRTEDQVRKELVDAKDQEYKQIKTLIDTNNSFKYYLIEKNSKEVATNIILDKNKTIKDYVENNSLYSLEISSDKEEIEYQQYAYVTTKYEAYFFVATNLDKNSQVSKDIAYYSSIRQRLIKESIIAIVALFFGVGLYCVYRKKPVERIQFLDKVGVKIPIDLKYILFLVSPYIMLNISIGVDMNFSWYKIIGLSLLACYILIFINFMKYSYNTLRQKDLVLRELKNSAVVKFWTILKTSLKASLLLKNVMLKVVGIIVLTAILCICFIYIQAPYEKDLEILCYLYIITYIFIVPIYTLNKIAYFNKLVVGSEEIAKGNLKYELPEKGNGYLSKLAKNINNMKVGYENSIKDRLVSERFKADLITNVSHDLKTPLTSIINYVDLLKNESLSKADRDSYLAILDKKSTRLKYLIEDLFEASKISSGATQLILEKLEVGALLKQALGEFDEKIEKSTLVFKLSVPENKIYLELDGKKTWRVFENLLSNILKYSHPSTRVYIDIIETESTVNIIMKNISAYEMEFTAEEIFERFKRGDKSRSTEGSGLGLAIAKSIVELENGNLNIDIDGDLFKVTIEFLKAK